MRGNLEVVKEMEANLEPGFARSCKGPIKGYRALAVIGYFYLSESALGGADKIGGVFGRYNIGFSIVIVPRQENGIA